MRKYIVKRVLSVIPVLLIISLIIFSISFFAKGDSSSFALGDNALQSEIINYQENIKEDNFFSSYINFIINFIKGDWGNSVINNQSVKTLIFSRLPLTLEISFLSLIISLLISVPLAINSTENKNTIKEERNDIISIIFLSIPSFILALLLFVIFTLTLKWFSVTDYTNFLTNPISHIKSLILPSLSLGIMYSALIYRSLKDALSITLKEDYIRLAKAKGLTKREIYFPHATKNVAVTLLSVITQSFISLFVGSAVIEFIFSLPGFGSLIYSSVIRRDLNTLRTIVTLIAIINVFIHLLSDILYSILDKRISLSKEVKSE